MENKKNEMPEPRRVEKVVKKAVIPDGYCKILNLKTGEVQIMAKGTAEKLKKNRKIKILNN